MIPETPKKADETEGLRRQRHEQTIEAIDNGEVVGPSIIEIPNPVILEAGSLLRIEDQYGCEYIMEVETAEPLTDSSSENQLPNVVYVKGKSRKLAEAIESGR